MYVRQTPFYFPRSVSSLIILFMVGICASWAQPGVKDQEKIVQEHLMYEEYAQSIPYLKELIQLDASNANYNFWYGKCLYMTYKQVESLTFLEKANAINPDIDVEFHYWYGASLQYNKHFQEAIVQYELDKQKRNFLPSAVFLDDLFIKQCKSALNMKPLPDQEKVEVLNMGEGINTEFPEHSPVISANDSILLFTARRPDCKGANPEKMFYDEDIYIAVRGEGGYWSKGKNIDFPVNSKGHDATVSLSPDGKSLFLYRHKEKGGLFYTHFDEGSMGGWEEPHKVDKPVNSKYYETSLCYSKDSSKVFFSSDRPGGLGGMDIWMMTRIGKDEYSEPKNLGSQINTPYDEDAPYLHLNGSRLYFSSNGPASMGGYDIFVTQFDTIGKSWGPSVNLGEPINTTDNEIYFVISQSGKFGYLTSGRPDGFGEKDIYEIKFPYFPYPSNVYEILLDPVVLDQKTQQRIFAAVDIVDPQTLMLIQTIYLHPDSQQTLVSLDATRGYQLNVRADGYSSTTETLPPFGKLTDKVTLKKTYVLSKPILADNEHPTEEPVSIPQPDTPVPVKPEPSLIEKIKKVSVRNVYFDFDRANLRTEDLPEIDQIVKLMLENPELRVSLSGHTDYYGTSVYNDALSQSRSLSVQQYLISSGVSPDRIILLFAGENRPIESNDNDEGRQFNRRTEMTLFSGETPLLTSLKWKNDGTKIRVDHTKPRGLPGYDANEGSITNITTTDVSIPEPVTTVTGKPVIRNVYFDFDRSEITPGSAQELQKLIAMLQQNPGYRVEVLGHTDAIGSIEYNQQLSERRTASVVSWLQQHIGATDRITTVGYSELQPIMDNSSAEGRMYNRRVEFRILSGDQEILRSLK